MAKTALVVDDSPSMRLLVTQVLRACGFATVEAENGADAITKLGPSIDLVISDVNMPVMDGVTFVQKLRAVPSMKSTPVLMLTTEVGQAIKDRARAAGATGWLTKPFAPEQLRAVLGRVCP